MPAKLNLTFLTHFSHAKTNFLPGATQLLYETPNLLLLLLLLLLFKTC
jgi:hypothetical protein